ALLEMEDIVRAAGFIPFAAAALVAQHTYGEIQVGRPNADDLAEDRAFAAQAAAKLEQGSLLPVSVPGNRPYREGGGRGKFRPQTNDKCVKCGLCARECPQGAIDPQDVTRIDDSKCLACFRCIRRCPVGAKNMEVPAYQAFAKDFSAKLVVRRENEYFL
ncbi:MAG: 4Fe-4S binding protein, partial [Butyricicoccus sp.]